jgi:4-hydroxy-4-methyl-2-oxoglutarate aldolase
VEVEIFGRRIVPGQLIHADKHGFLAIPLGDEAGLLEATRFMDANECQTVIVAARNGAGKSPSEICDAMDRAGEAYRAAVREKFGLKS